MWEATVATVLQGPGNAGARPLFSLELCFILNFFPLLHLQAVWKPNMPPIEVGSEISAFFLPEHAPYLCLSFEKIKYHQVSKNIYLGALREFLLGEKVLFQRRQGINLLKIHTPQAIALLQLPKAGLHFPWPPCQLGPFRERSHLAVFQEEADKSSGDCNTLISITKQINTQWPRQRAGEMVN